MAVLRDNVVLEASDTAHEWGVRPGITKHLAKRRCPALQFENFDPDNFKAAFAEVWNLFADHSPLVEPTDYHEGYIDLTGCSHRQSLADLLRQAVWRLRFQYGLGLGWGGGQDRWLARAACGTNRFIAPAEESVFLQNCALKNLRLPGDLVERLMRLGIKSAADLLDTPVSLLQSHLAIPHTALRPFLQRGDAFVRGLFPPPTLEVHAEIDGWGDAAVHRALSEAAVQAAELLKHYAQLCSEVTITFSWRSGQSSQQVKLTKPAQSAAVLQRLLLNQLPAHYINQLQRITILLGGLLPAPRTQAELWQNTKNDPDRIEQLESIRALADRKFGTSSLQTASRFAQQVPPRFAQLIYARRGLRLP